MKRILLYLALVVVIILIVLTYTGDINLKHLHFTLPNGLNFQQAAPALAAQLSQHQVQASSSSSSYVVTGAPTITASFINQVLSAYHSPATNTGQSLYDLCVQYGIDPVFALAFFLHESTFGKYGMATVTLSLGNMRCMAAYACYHGFAAFSSWEQGYRAWYQLIRSNYVARGLQTVAQIVPVYAPSSDNNAPVSYIAAIEHTVSTWRSGRLEV